MFPRPHTVLRTRPTLIFYCQHSLGIGHLTRSFALAAALMEHFHVVFLNGGRLPSGLPVPSGLEIVDLPALGMDDGHTVISRDATHGVAQAQLARRTMIDDAVRQHRPAVLLVELFPFGRKKFAGEILPMIRAVKKQAGAPALVACSLRDILVDARPDQQHHDDRARWLTDRYFDAVLVHADPSFARLEDSFNPRRPMRTPVHYTGCVVPWRPPAGHQPRGQQVLVSAGGGMVGAELFRTALAARRLLRLPIPMRIITGPFLPNDAWAALQQSVQGEDDVELLRHVPDMVHEMRQARLSISQCGYNTALDIVVSGVPALVVPYAAPGENEQTERAARMAARGAMQTLSADALTPTVLAAAIDALMVFQPRAAALKLDGAYQTAVSLRDLHQGAERSVTRNAA